MPCGDPPVYQLGFFAWAPNYGDPRFTAAAAPPPQMPVYVTIGAPESAEELQRKIAACEQALAGLRAQLGALQADADQV